ncbi:sensor histidine kinase [Chondromyces crocatus]|uniref:sensor histidine kinase n=1 Tax=Chondromyces crocatus TaxID=52 RepID=UPI0012E269F2|nr:ATP-binding protein [Chondromyces crocatus]
MLFEEGSPISMLLGLPSPRPTLASKAARFLRRGWMVPSVALAFVAIAAIALHDEQRDHEAALEALARQQQMFALVLSDELVARLSAVQRDAHVVADDLAAAHDPPASLRQAYQSIEVTPAAQRLREPPPAQSLRVEAPSSDGRTVALTVPVAWLIRSSSRIERGGDVVVLVRPPGDTRWQTVSSAQRISEPLTQAVATGSETARLEPHEAVALGLPERRAVAGVITTDTGRLGPFSVAVVASASHERERWYRTRSRLLAGVLVPGGLIVAFAAVALRRQRRELELEKKLALAALIRASDERLARASRAATTGTLAMGIAHEISTPLGVIVGRAEQLEARVGTDPKAVRALHAISEQAGRISEVVRGFLDLARGGAPSLRPVDPEDVVRGALRLVEHRFLTASVLLVADMDGCLPVLSGELRLLEHALVNLLLNACEASVSGARVSLSVRGTPTTVDFLVEDRGSGIRAENIARATEPFFTTKPEGAGLGLAIAHEIVSIHRGTLSLEPRDGGGTRAYVRLPRGGDHADA